MARECKITHIRIDGGLFILSSMPVDWKATVEGNLVNGGDVYVKIEGSYGPIWTYVRSGREGKVVAFDVGERFTFYSDIPVPTGFHS